MPRGAKPQKGWGPVEVEQMKQLVPFLDAAKRGLVLSRWRPGDPVEELLAPITLQVLVAVSRECGLGELLREASHA
jgi:hypothetical protein